MRLTNTEFKVCKNTAPLFITNLSDDEKAQIINCAIPLINKEYAAIKMSLYHDYEESGNRSRYENAIDERCKDLSNLIFAEKLENKNRFIPSIIDLIYLITSETAWWLPAHNLYKRDTKTEDYPDTTEPIICLSSAEKSALLSLSILLLKDKLPKQCVKHVIKNIKERTLRVYEEKTFWWMGKNDEHLNNWTPWCIQNILLCYLICEEDEGKIRKGIEQSLKSLEKFIGQYDEDGCCEEGAQYYHHAVLTFMGAIYVLNLLTDNSFDYVFTYPLVSNMLDYIRYINISDNAYINIGDCDQILEYLDLKTYFFAKIVKNKALCSFISSNWSKNTAPDKLLINSRYAFDRILCYQCIKDAKNEELINNKAYALKHYKSTNLFLYNQGPFNLAVNGSNNGVSHNHNDSGSFILYKNNKAIFIDVGVETYNSKTFSKQRYDIWTMQDKFHNLTAFNTIKQKDGKDFGVKVISYDENEITLSMQSAYEGVKLDQYYNREIHINNDEVTLCDKTNIQDEHYLVLMSKEKPVKEEFGFSICDAHINTECKFNVEEIITEDKRLLKSYPSGKLYRITIAYSDEIKLCIN